MAWTKLGRLYDAPALHPKLATHAANPVPVPLEGDVYRVYFSGRDEQNRSSVGCVDIDLRERAVVSTHSTPVFEHGDEASFYSHGVSIGNWYEADSRRFMLFMGWRNPPGGHWHGEIGRLVFDGDLALRLDPERPFLPLSPTDPVSLSYPWVMRDGAGVYRMWYGSTREWDAGNGEMLHVIQYAESKDGEAWSLCGLAVPYVLGVAQAFSRPSVLYTEGLGYEMWFSYRGANGTYRIGYAVSATGRDWRLKLESSGIDVAEQGWDAEMIEYPYVFRHRGEVYMLYNGNGYGKSGFGLARLQR